MFLFAFLWFIAFHIPLGHMHVFLLEVSVHLLPKHIFDWFIVFYFLSCSNRALRILDITLHQINSGQLFCPMGYLFFLTIISIALQKFYGFIYCHRLSLLQLIRFINNSVNWFINNSSAINIVMSLTMFSQYDLWIWL